MKKFPMPTISYHREGSGPVEKFYLIKDYGQMLKDKGFNPSQMSCEQIRSALESLK